MFFLFLMVINNPGSALALDVNGIIDEDRTFSIADSPVHIIGDVLIAQGATLTIEPGVTVGFQSLANASRGFLLDVEGTLDARGNCSATHPVYCAGQRTSLGRNCIS